MATKTVAVTPDDFTRVQGELNRDVLMERENILRISTLGLLAGVNIHALGAPGVAKSFAIRQFCDRITGASYFEKPLHPMLPADAVIGPYDIAEFAKSGDLKRNVDGYAPRAHVLFIDEITRGNGPMTDSMLSLMNVGERMCEINGGMSLAWACAVFTASNHWFAPDDLQAQAFSDRITLMLEVEPIQSDANFIDLFGRHHERVNGTGTGATPSEFITLDQLVEAQRQVREVEPAADFANELAQVRRKATLAGLIVSDRRWLELGLVCRANAWMAGRTQLAPDDLAVVEHGMWRDPAHRPEAHKIVLDYHSFYEQEATKYREEIEPLLEDLAQLQPVMDGALPEEGVDSDVMGKVVVLARQFAHSKTRVDASIAKATKESRDPGSLLDLQNTLTNVEDWCVSHKLPRWDS